MKKASLIFILILATTITSYSKVWTVDNAGRIANFTSLTAAITAAAAGDTLMLGGSPTVYENFTIAKKLTFIGPGYLLTENPNTIEYKVPATIATVTLSPGSEGSALIGIMISTTLTINCANVMVKRCHFASRAIINGNNNTFKQNYFTITNFNIQLSVTGINNIIRNNCFIGYYSSGSWNTMINCGTTNLVENNVFITGSITINSSLFNNNIMSSNGLANFSNCVPYNNIGSSTQFGTINGNKSNVSMALVFVASGTSDGKYVLAPGSPALAAGLEGVDCGMFGGPDPYVLSGIPNIPVITVLTVPTRTNPANGLNVNMNVKSNK